MNHFDFFRHDLNLLVAFDALYAEKSVSVAAQKMGISQSAMSQSLARLRTAFDDELFIRSSRGMEPTRLAIELSTPLHDTLLRVHKLLVSRPAFDPAKAERVFSLTMSDTQQLSLLPATLERLSREAPMVTLRTLPLERERVDKQLDEGQLDLAISRFEQPDARHGTELLFEENHVCLFNPKLVKVSKAMTLEEYMRYPHVMISHGGGLTGAVDDQLPARAGKRRMALTTPYSQAIPYILEQVAAIGIIPGRMAARCMKSASLSQASAPIKLAPYRIHMKWHARNSNDPGLQWLQGIIRDAANQPLKPAAPRKR
jgi:LysR family transcriptional activator of mexEF-oprN operon